MILANTEELHEKIANLCSRIRDLESALGILQASVSTQPHPLLRDDLLQVKSPFPKVGENASERSVDLVDIVSLVQDEDKPSFDSFGM